MAIAPNGSPCPRVANPLVLPDSVNGIFGGVSFLRLAGSTRDELEDPFADFAVEQGTAVFAANPPRPGGFSIFTNLPPVGTCISSAGLSQESESSGSVTSLETNVDAGTEITVTRSDGEQRVIPLPDGASLGGGLPGGDTLPLFLDAGRFRIESEGGADVGAFGLDVDIPAPVEWTNRDGLARVSRSGFEVRWQGGTAGQTIAILGAGSNGIDRADASFACNGRRRGRLVPRARPRASEPSQRAGLRRRPDHAAQPERAGSTQRAWCRRRVSFVNLDGLPHDILRD